MFEFYNVVCHFFSTVCITDDEIGVILGYYAEYSGNFLLTFRNNLSVLEEGIDWLFRNVGNYQHMLRNTS
jgi:hypothetical protein